MRRVPVQLLLGLLLVLPAMAGCATDDGPGSSATGPTSSSLPSSAEPTSPVPSSPIRTLTMLTQPAQPLTGDLRADLRQSSRDVALGRFQVWITNGLDVDVTPTRIVYTDPMLSRPVRAGRLREVPSGSFRGYTVDEIRPTCIGDPGPPSLVVEYAGKRVTLDVEDETSVVGRYSAARCEEIAVAKIAHLEWSPGIKVQGSGRSAVAIFRLTATPTGLPGGVLHIDTIGGTPVFTSADGDYWSPAATIRSDGPVVHFDLPAQPARCDPHVFGDSGGITAFLVNVRIDGVGKGQILLRMSPAVSREAIDYAVTACGIK